MEIKIAHCADLHIGAKCGDISEEKGVVVANCIKESFFELLQVCDREKVDVLLIAGDFFDDTGIKAADVKEVMARMKDCGYKIFISPGNHDPFTPDSPYKRFDWPSNVVIFESAEIKKFYMEEKNAAIWGNAFGGAHEWSRLLKDVRIDDENVLNICVTHGDLSSGAESRYNLIKTEDIESSGMDYVALGHIHKRTEICRAGKVSYAYSGNVQGTGFDELGEKGFYIGTVSKGVCNLKFRKLNGRRFEVVHVDVSDCVYANDFIDATMQLLKANYGEDYERNLYKIVLEGYVSEEVAVDLSLINSLINEKVFYANTLDMTKPEIDMDKLKYGTDFRSLFIKKMAERIESSGSEDESKMIEDALKLGLKAFEGSVKYIDN